MSTINDLAVVSSVSSADKLPLWSNANGVTRGLPISVLDGRYLTAEDIASFAVSPTIEIFISDILPNPDNLPTFTAGSTHALTLANQYFSASNLEVHFDGTFQLNDQLSLVGFGLAFSDPNTGLPSPIPLGVEKVQISGGAVRVISTPSAGTVTTDILSDGAVTDVKVAAGAGISSSKLSFLQNGTGAVARTVLSKLQDTVSVMDFGAVGVPIGQTPTVDATAAFQAAVNSGAFVIEVPAMAFLITGQITMQQGARIIGKSGRGSIIPTTSQAQFGYGSFIYLTSTALSPFLYRSGNAFVGLTFYYPNQLRALSTPIAYPYAFTFNPAVFSTILVDVLWRDIYFFNMYQGIDARCNHLDFEFNRVQGCALSCGINIDGGGGGDYLNQINLSYYYFGQVGDPFNTWIMANGNIIQIGRSDDIDMQQVFLGTGFIPLRTYVGSVNETFGPYGTIRGLSIDATTNGIVSEATYPNFGLGMVVQGFMCNTKAVDVQLSNAANTASHWQFIGGATWGPRNESFLVGQAGSSLLLDGIPIHTGILADSVRVLAANVDLSLNDVWFDSTVPSIVTVGFVLNSLKVTNCNMVTAGAPNLHGAAATHQVIKDNIGFNEVFYSVASAALISVLNIGDNVNLSGSTTVTSIGGGWVGREVYFRPSTSNIIFGTGGNILGGKTLVAAVGAKYICDGTNWSPMA